MSVLAGGVRSSGERADLGAHVGPEGAGQVVATTFSVPAASLGAWQARLAGRGIASVPGHTRFGDDVLAFRDPSIVPSR